MAQIASPLKAETAMEWLSSASQSNNMFTTKEMDSIYVDHVEQLCRNEWEKTAQLQSFEHYISPPRLQAEAFKQYSHQLKVIMSASSSQNQGAQPPTVQHAVAPQAGIITDFTWDNKSPTVTAKYTVRVPFVYQQGHLEDYINVTATIVAPKNKKLKAEGGSPRPHEITRESLVDKKWLLYLCGGPGASNSPKDHINKFFIKEGYWLLYPNYRGLGDEKSWKIDASNLAQEAQKVRLLEHEYLAQLRQDNIVRDLERIRMSLGATSHWDLLGQSYGGWIVFSYLSMCPEHVKYAFVTGGVPPILSTPQEAHIVLYNTLVKENKKYYATYPKHKKVILDTVEVITRYSSDESQKWKLSGLTATMFLGIGRNLGSVGGYSDVHGLVEATWKAVKGLKIDKDTRIDDSVMKSIKDVWKHHQRPLYAALLDSIYCDGLKGPIASNWAGDEEARRRPGFEWVHGDVKEIVKTKLEAYEVKDAARKAAKKAGKSMPAESEEQYAEDVLYLGGEMAYRHTFFDFSNIEPLYPIVDTLQAKINWPALYNVQALKNCRVNLNAIMYTQDMYVPIESCRRVKNQVIGEDHKYFLLEENKKLKHGAIKDDKEGRKVLDELWKLAKRKRPVT